MRVYVDFDDVLCETAQGLAVLALEMFGRQVPFEKIHAFDLRVAFDLHLEQYLALMERAHEPDFLRALPVMPGCVACLQQWQGEGHEVVVVTGRPSFTHRVSRDWLERHGLLSLPVLYVDKYNRRHPVPVDAPPFLSLPELLQQHFDVVIDDSPVVLDVLQARAAGHTIVFDRPWNWTYGCAGGRTTRCCGWQEVAARVAQGVG